MSKGLESFLGKIKKAPQNKTYVDRFLALLIDEPSRVRLKLLYKLSVLIQDHQTLSALKVAYMALQEARAAKKKRHEIEVLQLIENCFRILGKNDKLSIIRKEKNQLIAEFQAAQKKAQQPSAPIPQTFPVEKPKDTAKIPQAPKVPQHNPGRLRIHVPDDGTVGSGQPKNTDNNFGKNVLKRPSFVEPVEEPPADEDFGTKRTQGYQQPPGSGEKMWKNREFPDNDPRYPTHLDKPRDSTRRSQARNPEFRMNDVTDSKIGLAKQNRSANSNHEFEAKERSKEDSRKSLLAAALGQEQKKKPLGFDDKPFVDVEGLFDDEPHDSNQQESQEVVASYGLPLAEPNEDLSDLPPLPNKFSQDEAISSDQTQILDGRDLGLPSESQAETQYLEPLPSHSESQNETPFVSPIESDLNKKRAQRISEYEALRIKCWLIFADRVRNAKGSGLDVKLQFFLRKNRIFLTPEFFQKFVSKLQIWQGDQSPLTLLEMEEIFFSQLTLVQQLAVFDQMHLRSEFYQLWEGYISGLVERRESRTALSLITRAVSSEIDLNWAVATYASLERIWADLGLQGFSWEQGDGCLEFANRLKQRPLPIASTVLTIS
ncbi:MAG: hypothetical protein HRU19_17995 [Pseudobacteriovorax sp.]|nr:hypothetical protein [Pseudobacteriovorax sp.]